MHVLTVDTSTNSEQTNEQFFQKFTLLTSIFLTTEFIWRSVSNQLFVLISL